MAAMGSGVGVCVTTGAGVGKVDNDASDVHEDGGEMWMAAAGGGVDGGITTDAGATWAAPAGEGVAKEESQSTSAIGVVSLFFLLERGRGCGSCKSFRCSQ